MHSSLPLRSLEQHICWASFQTYRTSHQIPNQTRFEDYTTLEEDPSKCIAQQEDYQSCKNGDSTENLATILICEVHTIPIAPSVSTPSMTNSPQWSETNMLSLKMHRTHSPHSDTFYQYLVVRWFLQNRKWGSACLSSCDGTHRKWKQWWANVLRMAHWWIQPLTGYLRDLDMFRFSGQLWRDSCLAGTGIGCTETLGSMHRIVISSIY